VDVVVDQAGHAVAGDHDKVIIKYSTEVIQHDICKELPEDLAVDEEEDRSDDVERDFDRDAEPDNDKDADKDF
jgi:hypothetical protein